MARCKTVLLSFKSIPLLSISTFFCLGVIISYYLGWNLAMKTILLNNIALISLFCLFKVNFEYHKLLFILFVALFFGIVRVGILEYLENQHSHISHFYNQNLCIKAKVNQIFIQDGSFQKLGVDSIGLTDERKCADIGTLGGGLLISAYNAESVGIRDLVFACGQILEPEKSNGFNYKTYLRGKGIYALMKVNNMEVLAKESDAHPLVILARIKAYLTHGISRYLGEPHASLLGGIVYGGDQTMSEDFANELQRSGTTHIIAVSGYNVTLLISSVGMFSSFVGRKKIYLLTIVFIFVFVLFVGSSNIPVVRAGAMGITFVASGLLGKKRNGLVLLSFVVACLLAQNPLTFTQLSFLLSFFATLGLILFSDTAKKKLQFVPEIVREDVASTFSAIMFTLPITIGTFNSLSVIAPVSNLFVLPVVPFITIIGLIYVLLLFTGINWVIYPLGLVLWGLLEYVIRVVRVCGGASIAMISFPRTISSLIACLLWLSILIIMINSIPKYDEKNSSA